MADSGPEEDTSDKRPVRASRKREADVVTVEEQGDATRSAAAKEIGIGTRDTYGGLLDSGSHPPRPPLRSTTPPPRRPRRLPPCSPQQPTTAAQRWTTTRSCYRSTSSRARRTPYTISSDASPQEIKRAFKGLVLKYHPDKSPDTPDWVVQAITCAYEKLSGKPVAGSEDTGGASSDAAPNADFYEQMFSESGWADADFEEGELDDTVYAANGDDGVEYSKEELAAVQDSSEEERRTRRLRPTKQRSWDRDSSS